MKTTITITIISIISLLIVLILLGYSIYTNNWFALLGILTTFILATIRTAISLALRDNLK
jgi:hypothetical protein